MATPKMPNLPTATIPKVAPATNKQHIFILSWNYTHFDRLWIFLSRNYKSIAMQKEDIFLQFFLGGRVWMYSVVSIQPQIWDNDAIWVWRSLAFLPSQKPPIPHRHFSTAVIQESSVAGFYLWEGLLLCWLSSSSSAQKTVNVSFPTLHFFSSSVCYFSCWLALWLTPWLTSTKQYCLSRPPPPHFPSLSLLLLPPLLFLLPSLFLILAAFPSPIAPFSIWPPLINSLDVCSYLILFLVDQSLASYWLNLNLTWGQLCHFKAVWAK